MNPPDNNFLRPRLSFKRKTANFPLWLVLAVGIFGSLIAPGYGQTTNYSFFSVVGSSTNGSNDGIGIFAQFNSAAGVVADANYHVYVSDTGNDTIREIFSIQTNWEVITIAGAAGVTGSTDNSTNALSGRFNGNTGIAVNSNGDIFVADTLNDTIRELIPQGSNVWSLTTIAGLAGVSGTNDNSTNALQGRLNHPRGLALDTNNLYVADSLNQTIRVLSPVGTNWSITTIAGTAELTGTNDGTNFTARFNSPKGIAVDAAGNIYVADSTNDEIRAITRSGTNYVVSTFAGLAGVAGSADGTNSGARFNAPAGVAINRHGNLFVADTGNEIIREIVPSGTNNVVTTIGGIAGVAGYHDGTGTNALLTDPEDLCIDPAGNLLLDGNNVSVGVVTLVVVGGPDSPNFSEIEVVVSPPAAVTDGGAWTLQNSMEPFGAQSTQGPYVLPVTAFPANIIFSNLVGWTSPVGSPITVSSTFCEITALPYSTAPPVLTISPASGLGIIGVSNATYEIDWTTNLQNGTWPTLGTITLYPGTNQQYASWQTLTQANPHASQAFYLAKWLGY